MKLFSSIIKVLTCIILINLFSVDSTYACDNSTFTVDSQTDNGDGTTTYCMTLEIELGGLDASFYGFVLQFYSSINTPSVVAGSYPSQLTTSDLTTGSLAETLIGLTGSDINSEASDSDWNPYLNQINTLITSIYLILVTRRP